MNNKKSSFAKNTNSKKIIKERALSKKEKKLKNSNKSYKSFSNIQYNTNNKAKETIFDNIYKTILNGSLKNLKINEKNQILQKK